MNVCALIAIFSNPPSLLQNSMCADETCVSDISSLLTKELEVDSSSSSNTNSIDSLLETQFAKLFNNLSMLRTVYVPVKQCPVEMQAYLCTQVTSSTLGLPIQQLNNISVPFRTLKTTLACDTTLPQFMLRLSEATRHVEILEKEETSLPVDSQFLPRLTVALGCQPDFAFEEEHSPQHSMVWRSSASINEVSIGCRKQIVVDVLQELPSFFVLEIQRKHGKERLRNPWYSDLLPTDFASSHNCDCMFRVQAVVVALSEEDSLFYQEYLQQKQASTFAAISFNDRDKTWTWFDGANQQIIDVTKMIGDMKKDDWLCETETEQQLDKALRILEQSIVLVVCHCLS